MAESIRARGTVLMLWHESLGELTELRGNDPESRALLHTLQFGARPPRARTGSPTGLLVRLGEALSRQIDLIVEYGRLDPDGADFYRSLQRDLAGLDRHALEDPVGLLLERVCAQVHEFYEQVLGAPLGPRWPGVTWQVAPTRLHPYEAGDVALDPYTAAAFVVLGEQEASISICVHEQHFGPEAYLSLPAILTHEVFAHVPARPRQNHDPSVFTEGFMDWAALVFFEASCQHLLRGAQNLVLQHGRRLSDLQKGHPKFQRLGQTGEGDVLVPARRTGHQYAEDVVTWWALRNPDLDIDGIRLCLAGLAARLNVHDGGLSMNDKDEFVTALSPRRPAMERALKQYLTDPTIALEPLLRAAGVGPGSSSRDRGNA
ncbi:hypothetical protein Kisp01_30310 [Kineosporia sp. NBRC 101677]|uniref:hypothetical protein n=1 Tax=Kineosporia sp. NBRC 101677 TaxID=3032197 RepID=UPI0024A59F53|nr:hypothetical protein [Kineosporia sp. NBRC 101677]GLY16016.1 hypothetical protein Kisp01_30310 [Kineosporia sp. NBRC 101677]